MSNYIAFLHAGIDKPGERAIRDGNALANKCLEKLGQIDNPEQFPPKLLLLLISAQYLGGETELDEVRARQLIAGVRQSFFEAGYRDIPLIGSSVAAVFYEQEIYHEGALLVCLASRMLEASVSVATGVSSDPDAAVDRLIRDLDIVHLLTEYPRALPNRVLLTFFPGTGTTGTTTRNSADKLHTLLLEKLTYQIPIVGGVSSANDRDRKKHGLQFVNQQTYSDALAACLIRSGLPLATSMATGLQPVDNKGVALTDGYKNVLNVKRFSKDYIDEFEQGVPETLFGDLKKPILLKDYGPDGTVIRAKVLPDEKPKKVRILRPVSVSLALEPTVPDPTKMYEETLEAHGFSLKRAKLDNPAGCLSFKCYGHLAYNEELGLILPWGIRKMQSKFGIPHYVGGFYDGEIATDKTGAFRCGSWSVAALIVGDEISERTAVQGGLSALETHGLALTGTFDLDEALKQSLDLVWDLGFPGAMISLMMTNHNPTLSEESKAMLVPIKAVGTRYERVLEKIKIEGVEGQMPVGDKPIFITHAPIDKDDPFAAAGIVAEYVLPLHDSAGQVFALLRVDVGDQDKNEIHSAVREILNSISAIVGAAINRISNWQENRIARELDRALTRSLSANTRKEGLPQFIRGALNAFGLSNAHIRLVNAAHDALVLEAGEGAYYEAAKIKRLEVSFEDWSPSCEAFVRGEATIINDTKNNSAHRRLSESYASNVQMNDALRRLESYANVPFKDENGERLGTISLLATDKWFFNSHHERALGVLSRRVAFLIQHLKTKEETRNAIEDAQRIYAQESRTAKNLQFIRNVTQKLDLVFDAETLRLSDISNVLESATGTLCEVVGADSGAVYLWDEDQQMYILRGQFGWKDENWIHIARYRRTDDWIGAKGLADRPRYVSDLFQYYESQHYTNPCGRYAPQIFGRHLSPDFTVEAIAAPLNVAGKQIGVVTLYGRPRSQALQRTQFHATAIWVLQEGVNRFTGIVKGLLDHQRVLDEERASARRTQLTELFAVRRRSDSFEATAGAALVKIFRASRVNFYALSSESQDFALIHQTPSNDKPGARKDPADQGDDLIRNAAAQASLLVRRWRAPDSDVVDPELAVTDGMIARAALPIPTEDEEVLVIDVHWDSQTLIELEPFHDFTVSELDELTARLGSLYQRHLVLAKSDAEERRRAQSRAVAHAFGMMMAQCEHKFETLLREVLRRARAFSKTDSPEVRQDVCDLPGFIETERLWIDRCRAAADKAGEEKTYTGLRKVIEAAINESVLAKDLGKVRHSITIPKEVKVFANHHALREVFSNLINNAAEAISDAGTLKIRLPESNDYLPDSNGYVEPLPPLNMMVVLFEDNGVGMDKQALRQMGTQHSTKPGHQGLGTVICEALVQSQNGEVEWRSVPGHRTTVRVTLPLTQTEEW